MKRLIALFALIAWAIPALAQTPEEILSRMEEAVSQHESDGVVMTIDIKIPLLGTLSTTAWSLGDKMRGEMKMGGESSIVWSDGVTQWSYTPKENTIEIENDKPKASGEADSEMFKGITEGYDVSIKKETDEAWYFQCKKSKSNKEKDDPKKMEVVVSKSTYFPISLSAKLHGVTTTIRNIGFGVTEEQVTFDMSKYPGAKVVDKR